MTFEEIGKENNERIESSANEWSLRRYTIAELKYLLEVPTGKNNKRSLVRPEKPNTWTTYHHYMTEPSNQPVYSDQQITGYEIKEDSFSDYEEIPEKYEDDPCQSSNCNEIKDVFTHEEKSVAKSNDSLFADLSIKATKDECIASKTFQRLPSKLRTFKSSIVKEEDQKSIISQERRKKMIPEEQTKKTWVCCHCTKNCMATKRGGHCITKTHLDYLAANIVCPACLHQSKLAQREK